MNVYVETNFILELALVQDEREACEQILDACESGPAALVLPAFCLAESYEMLGRRAKKRRRIESDLKEELRQLERSVPYKDEIDALRGVAGLLIRSAVEDDRRLTAVLERISRIAAIIPLEADIIASIRPCRETYKLEPQDLIVYLSVQRHLASAGAVESCFIVRDKHFTDPDIIDALATLRCTMLFGFAEGCRYLQAHGHAGSVS
jgi:predicted nucleic acid-binding protein